MTWKTGDSVAIPVKLETAAGAALDYANQAAFVAAGGAIVWYSGATALGVQPTYTVGNIGSGWHAITFTLPAGVDHMLITAPASGVANPVDVLLITPTYDTDSIYAATIALAVPVSVPVSGFIGGAQSYDFNSIEADSVSQQFQIPLASLKVFNPGGALIYQFADLSDIGGFPWRIDATARATDAASQLPSASPAYTFSCAITDKINRYVAIGWDIAPAGAVVSAVDGTLNSKPFKYDIQLRPPTGSTYASYKLTVATGVHTIYRQETVV